MRNNGGGLFPAGVELARMLIESGDIVLIADSQGVMDSYEATGTSIDSKAPVAVLVNKGTASASEVTTLCLTSHQSRLVWYCCGTTCRTAFKTDRSVCVAPTSSLHHYCIHIIMAQPSKACLLQLARSRMPSGRRCIQCGTPVCVQFAAWVHVSHSRPTCPAPYLNVA